ncbi:TadE family protein [Veronia pacifica]|uniref:TadE-like domain-containing protein n=1 Tax=Veronia pacifica TaxID=1080227 RepID=A0A1C3ES59_9GAMM|nr:TadE/TadG family type IV pilus assembly protein [Veronia pacifica]ODA36076.1 hypothetical protein A8L45_00270 [Veronia pacifica]
MTLKPPHVWRGTRRQTGSFTVEFALGAIVLFFTMMLIFEGCRFIYLVNLTDTALREASRDSHLIDDPKVKEGYKKHFSDFLKGKGHQSSLWRIIVQPQKFFFSVRLYRDLDAYVAGNYSSTRNRNLFAEYRITYKYSPLLKVPGISSFTIKRQSLRLQEHEEWENK